MYLEYTFVYMSFNGLLSSMFPILSTAFCVKLGNLRADCQKFGPYGGELF